MRVLALALALSATFALASAQACDSPMPNVFFTEKGGFTLGWQFLSSSHQSTNDTVEIQVSLMGTAYIALGLGMSMTPADMVIMWVLDNGTAVANDYWSTKHAPPSLDTALGGHDNVQVVCGSRQGNRTTVRFRRPVAAMDPDFDKAIVNGVNDMVYAYLVGTPGTIAFHGDNHNHIRVDFSRTDGIPNTAFGEEETGLTSRQLVNMMNVGTLVTLQVEDSAGAPGYSNWPYGSVAGYADTEPSTGAPYLLLSHLERNIINSQNYVNNCSLAIHHKLNDTDVMASPRTTLFGQLVLVPEKDLPAAQKVYLASHPEAKYWIGFPDFDLYQFIVSDVYWVGGFGNAHYIGFIDSELYLSHKL